MRGVMDAVSDPSIETVVVMSSAQVGKTETLLNIIGYHIHQDPAPMLMLQPTIEMGEAFSKDRLAPMIRDTPALKGKVKDPRARDSNNTLLHKAFPGGHVTIAGANSAASLASRPVRLVLCDEVDRYPESAGTEGDPVSLAQKRSSNFWNRKTVLCSTPTVQGHSRIERAYEASDQRHCLVDCPSCGHAQPLRWGQVIWHEDNPGDVHYQCEDCGSLWDDATRSRALRTCRWQARAETNGVAGFHLNELYSPWSTLKGMVRRFHEAKGSPSLLKTWINTTLGETWVEQGEAPESDRLYERREDYPIGVVPEGASLLTAGCDIQGDRIEVSVWGWGPGMESWLIEHIVLEGDPYQAQVWDDLEAVLVRHWRHAAGGDVRIAKAAVDQGYATSQVQTFCRRHGTSWTMPVRGVDGWKAAEITQPKAIDLSTKTGKSRRRGARQRDVGTWPIKRDTYRWLKLPQPSDEDLESGSGFPPGYVHLPKVDQEFCRQLTAEQIVTRTVKGYSRQEWQKMRERNEALDCRVYAHAAAVALGVNRMGADEWDALAIEVKGNKPGRRNVEAEAPSKEEPASSPAPPPQPRTRGNAWLDQRGRTWL